MSDLVDLIPDDADLTAAEYALGVQDAEERRAAEQRMTADVAFARAVERWSAIFAPLADAIAAVAPPPTLWGRIEAAIEAARPSADLGREGVVELGLRRGLRLWRAAAASAGAIAAVLLAALLLGRPTMSPPALRPAPTSPASVQPLLVARLSSKSGGSSFVASLDPGSRELVITPGTIRTVAGRTPELWLIPTGGKPVALGLASFSRPIRLNGAAVGGAGRTILAVSIEPLGGSTTGQPTGPVVATGALTPL